MKYFQKMNAFSKIKYRLGLIYCLLEGLIVNYCSLHNYSSVFHVNNFKTALTMQYFIIMPGMQPQFLIFKTTELV